MQINLTSACYQKPKSEASSIKSVLPSTLSNRVWTPANYTSQTTWIPYPPFTELTRKPPTSRSKISTTTMDRYPCVNRYKHGVDCPGWVNVHGARCEDCVVVSEPRTHAHSS